MSIFSFVYRIKFYFGKWFLEKETRKYQYFKKTLSDPLVFQYANLLLVMFIYYKTVFP